MGELHDMRGDGGKRASEISARGWDVIPVVYGAPRRSQGAEVTA